MILKRATVETTLCQLSSQQLKEKIFARHCVACSLKKYLVGCNVVAWQSLLSGLSNWSAGAMSGEPLDLVRSPHQRLLVALGQFHHLGLAQAELCRSHQALLTHS